MENEYLGIIAIVGEEGSGKTTLALSFPKPLRHLDIDVGGFRRAAWRIKQDGIVSKAYPKPIQLDKLLGQLSEKDGGKLTVRFPKKVEQVKELWQQIVIDFVAACQDTECKSIVLDSATLLWNICHSGVLQEAQERQLINWKKEHPNQQFDENMFRERLQPVEYGPANDRMRMILHTARSFQKNLILTHYPTDVYGQIADGKGGLTDGRTGEKTMDGFKETGKLVDVVVWTSIKESYGEGGAKKKYPSAKFIKCGIEGMGLDAVGLEIPATYESIINLRNTMRGGS